MEATKAEAAAARRPTLITWDATYKPLRSPVDTEPLESRWSRCCSPQVPSGVTIIVDTEGRASSSLLLGGGLTTANSSTSHLHKGFPQGSYRPFQKQAGTPNGINSPVAARASSLYNGFGSAIRSSTAAGDSIINDNAHSNASAPPRSGHRRPLGQGGPASQQQSFVTNGLSSNVVPQQQQQQQRQHHHQQQQQQQQQSSQHQQQQTASTGINRSASGSPFSTRDTFALNSNSAAATQAPGRQQSAAGAATPRYKPTVLSGLIAGQEQDAANLVFRKVRGILNKLTPENFDKLSRDLLNVGLDSTHVLKGVILLIFEKALDEAKYSLMYASLCRTLCEQAPNFDPPPTNTFRRLLLAKCQDEFDNRKTALHEAPPNSDQRAIAKQKMLGNMRLIGELGKQGLLHEKILHDCLQTLLKGKKQEDVDLECLCHMVRTVGARLDTAQGRPLVDQYFQRMDKLCHQEGLSSRIRFMLQDVSELRRDGWMPRRRAAVGNLQQPTTLAHIRNQVMPPMAQRHHGGGGGQNGYGGHHGGQDSHGHGGGRGGSRRDNNALNEDIFYNGPMGSLKKHDASGDFYEFLESPKSASIVSGGGHNRHDGRDGRDAPRHQNRFNNNNHHHRDNHYNNQRNAGGGGGGGQGGDSRGGGGGHGNHGPAMGMQLPLRLLKKNLPQNLDEISLRPHAAQPSLAKPKSMPPPGAQLLQNTAVHTGQSTLQAVSVKPTVATTPLPLKTEAKPKTVSKAEYQEKVMQLLQQDTNKEETAEGIGEVCDEFAKLDIPRKLMNDILVAVILDAMKKDSGSLDILEQLVTRFAPNGVSDTLAMVLRKLPSGEAAAQRAAQLVARLLVQNVLDFVDVSQWTDVATGDDSAPWIVSVLKILLDTEGEAKLVQRCKGANLLPHLLPAERNKDGLANMLDRHGLNCLQPLNIRLGKQLDECLPSAEKLQTFIDTQLDDATRQSSEFVLALVTAIMRHAHCPTPDDERAALAPFKNLLRRYCEKRNGIWALYAVQELWAKQGYPNGVLQRWFILFYNEDIIEDVEFLRWKEDVNDEFAGKGKGLFEVNKWLQWLQDAEEEEEDEGEE